MPPSLNEFVRHLEDSGILDAESLRPFLPPNAAPSTARNLALDLVRGKKLSRYQAEEAYKGRAKRLVLGKYLILERIGAGGMGQVFKARHRRMERVVAIKLLSPELVRQPGAITRFEREVKAAARLNHVNIITAHDADEADGLHFLVMEYVAGIDLSELVKKHGPQSVGRSLDIVLQTARGLEAAHAAGIVHRDIKPGNLLLDASGTVKILDLGLARFERHAIDGASPELTTTGAVMGTVDYMAPEQAIDTKSADARADIYALGCTLHWLLTGKAPYDGDTLVARLLAHRDKPIPRIVGPSGPVPEGVERVFRRMVAKSPDARYPTMATLIADLERIRADHSTSSMSTQPLLSDETLDAFPGFPETSLIPTAHAAPTPAIRTSPRDRRRRGRWAMIATGAVGAATVVGLLVAIPRRRETPVVPSSRADADSGSSTRQEQAGPPRGPVGKGALPTLDDVAKASSAAEPAVADGAAGKDLAFRQAGFERWIASVASLPPARQVDEVRGKMVECNPGFDPASLSARVEGAVVRQVICPTRHVTDLSPLRAFPDLQSLMLEGLPSPISPLVDLAPLEGLALRNLSAGFTNVSDLRPLAGMPLTELKVGRTRVSSLEPLEGMPLESLSLDGCPLASLAPLEGMPIRYLSIPSTGIADLSPLRGARIETLVCGGNPIADLSPLEGAPIAELAVESTGVSDLTPLRDAPLRRLFISYTRVADLGPIAGRPLVWLSMAHTTITSLEPLRGARLENLSYDASPVKDITALEGIPLRDVTMTYDEARDGAVLRGIRSLERINGKPVAEFWREHAPGD